MITRNLIPEFIGEQYRQGNTQGAFPAVVLFVDTSGFTNLAAGLTAYGSEGAELLADILSTVFEPMLDSVYRAGGYVAGFAGDAFKALFPGDSVGHYLGALQAAREILGQIEAQPVYETRYGAFPFAVRAAIADGEVQWGIWQGDSEIDVEQAAAYTYYGEAMDQAIAGEDFAERGQIVVTSSVLARIRAQSTLAARPLAGVAAGYWVVASETVAHINDNIPHSEPSIAVPFYAASLQGQQIQGEFRRVVSVFLNVPVLAEPGKRDPFFTVFFRLLAQYGGYLCRLGRVGAGDSGATYLLFWGAPVTHENDVERALSFLLALQESSSAPLRAGVSFQTAYAGFVGSRRQEEYTCHGIYVIQAARLLANAKPGQILVDEPTYVTASRQFNFSDLGRVSLKGFIEPQPSYQLGSRAESPQPVFYRGELVGRDNELASLIAFAAPALAGQFAGLVSIQGEAGSGKSRLLNQFSRQPEIAGRFRVLTGQADEILREPLNAFRYLLARYFRQSPQDDPQRQQAAFDHSLDALIEALPDGEPSQLLANELRRTRSFLAALLGFYEPDSLYARVDPSLRQENLFGAIRTLLAAESVRQPLLLILEDGQWFDDGSLALVNELLSYSVDIPLMLAVTTRESIDVAPDVAKRLDIQLESLGEEAIAQQVAGLLGDFPTASFLNQLARRTGGNPFFVEQVVLYLQEQNALVRQADGWAASLAAVLPPAGVQAVLVARLDTLARDVRHVVQTASVLGREFSLRILQAMLRDEGDLPLLIETAESEAIWAALSEMRYLFKHALLREAAYTMQLQARLRALHQLAAEVIEAQFADQIANHAADLAYHYRQAEQAGLERRYSIIAADAAAAQYANQLALSYLQRAEALTDVDQFADYAAVLLKQLKIYNLLADRQSQRATLDKLFSFIDKLDRFEQQIAIYDAEADYQEAVSDYDKALIAAKNAARVAPEGTIEYGKVMNSWGFIELRRGEYRSARPKAEQGLALAIQHNDILTQVDSERLLGMINYFQGQFQAAEPHFEAALRLSGQTDALGSYGSSLNNLGALLGRMGRFEEALPRFVEALAVREKIGDRRGQSSTLTNIGGINSQLGNWGEAMHYYGRALRLKQEVGDKVGETLVLNNLTSAHRNLGQISEARQTGARGLAILRETDDQRGYAMALSGYAELFAEEDPVQSEELLTEAMAILESIGDKSNIAATLTRLGGLRYQSAQWEDALTYFEEALRLYRETDERHNIPRAELQLLNCQARIRIDEPFRESLEAYLERLLKEDDASLDRNLAVGITIYDLLSYLDDDRADSFLQRSHNALQAQAARIADPDLRDGFLHRSRQGRRITAAYQSRFGAADGPGS